MVTLLLRVIADIVNKWQQNIHCFHCPTKILVSLSECQPCFTNYVCPIQEWDSTNYLVDLSGLYAKCSYTRAQTVAVSQRAPPDETEIVAAVDQTDGSGTDSNSVHGYIVNVINKWIKEKTFHTQVQIYFQILFILLIYLAIYISQKRNCIGVICDIPWCDVMRCDVMWCDVMWCSVMRCDVMGRDVMSSLDIHAPLKSTIVIHGPHTPWIDPEIIATKRERSRLNDRCKSPFDRKKIRDQCNFVRSLISKVKSHFS